MSAIITGVLKVTFGLFWNKARDFTANKLKEGDLADEKCRQFIVRELDDIKTKLDGLARKDLLASICFLQEGVCLLNMSLDQSNANHDGQTTSQPTQAQAVINNASLALSYAIAALKIVSEERFTSAKSRFKAAREEATRAFCNEALSLEDRILATKLRVVSTLLESLEDPEAAVNSCKLYLEALHMMPAVQETFSVHMDGGIKALINRSKRLENVKSVTTINVFLFDFTQKFTTFSSDIFSWPRIEIVKQPCYPILVDIETLNELRESGVNASVPYEIKLNIDSDDFSRLCSAVNSKGEIITRSRKNPGVLNVIDKTGEIKVVCSLLEEDTQARSFEILSLAIDADDCVYVVTKFEESQDVYRYKIFVYDDKFKIEKKLSLDFLTEKAGWINIAVSKNQKIVIHKHGEDRTHVCGNDGNLLCSFAVKSSRMSISDKNEIILVPKYSSNVYIYTEEGELKRSIKLPEHHVVRGLAFHHVSKKVIAYTSHRLKYSYNMLNCSKTGEVQALPLLHHADYYAKLTCHPSGPVAFVHRKGVVFL